MKKIEIYLIIIFTSIFLSQSINSAEIDIYKKIDLFGEVLKKINEDVFKFTSFFKQYQKGALA